MSGIIAQNSGRHTGLVKASSGGGGVWNLIETLTASSSATLSFTSGIDSTYDEYVFKWINIHPGQDGWRLTFQGSIDSGSNYNVAITSSHFKAQHDEADSATTLAYQTGGDLAQGTGFQPIGMDLGYDNDQSCCGILHLYDPSSTTFVKHFIATANDAGSTNFSVTSHVGGYFNTTSAIDAIQFKMSGNDMDAGSISLYGIT